MVDKALFTNTHGEWETPKELFTLLDQEFHFQLDPCATKENALCGYFFSGEDDGLRLSWNGLRVYVNPPYGRDIGLWTAKCLAEARQSATVVALLPARTDTTYWHRDVMESDEIRFVRGRIRFNLHGKPSQSAPFPSVIVVWGKRGFRHLPTISTLGIGVKK